MSVTPKHPERKAYEDIDWDSLQWEYENTKTSLAKLSEKFGSYPMQISREVKEKGWKKYDAVEAALQDHANSRPVVNPNRMLDTVAVRKVQEIVKELGDNYSPVDEPLVVMYAKNYERYLKLEQIVDKEGEVSISPKTGATYMNPHFSALQAVISNMAKLGDKLGLSIASRKRIGLKLGAEEKTKSLFDLVDNLSQGEDVAI